MSLCTLNYLWRYYSLMIIHNLLQTLQMRDTLERTGFSDFKLRGQGRYDFQVSCSAAAENHHCQFTRQRTVWISCSIKNTLYFNWRILKHSKISFMSQMKLSRSHLSVMVSLHFFMIMLHGCLLSRYVLKISIISRGGWQSMRYICYLQFICSQACTLCIARRASL